jgi:hypothetical protein
MKVNRNRTIAQRLLNQHRIPGVIFDEKHFNGCIHYEATLPLVDSLGRDVFQVS